MINVAAIASLRDLPQMAKYGLGSVFFYLLAGIVSFLCLTFTLQPTVASAYFMLSNLTIQLYLIMYMAMFVSAIRLRHTQPDVFRSFRVPCGNTGLMIEQ